MDDALKLDRKEQIIQQLLNKRAYKSSDNRQLYELTLSELESEYSRVSEKV
ncbi:Fur-regulated basic protein FbpA [Halalkalibacter okhensis]|uniref:Fur-regulated basic protein FbpA n=1 Tax=Halalkalibacter okhensis TaxID=333138 RepID=UPI000B022F16|nr:Fur-regulated basic protein FbpA [Halalkalibacter okhensis]